MTQLSQPSQPQEPQQQRQDYSACLVRMWRDGVNSPWRASAQLVQSGDVLRFADLEALFAFLKEQTAVIRNMDLE